MQLAAFSAGTIVKIDGIRFRLVAERPGGGWQGLELATRCLQNWGEEELHNAYVDGRLEFENELRAARPSARPPLVLDDLPPTKRRRAEFRLKFLRGADTRGVDFVRKSSAKNSALRKVLAEVSAELGRASPLSPATYYRWRADYERGGIQALAGNLSQSGRPPHPTAHIIHEVVQEVLETGRGAREIGAKATITVTAIHLRVAALIDLENKRRSVAGVPILPRASVSTIRRYWASYPALDRAIAEKGAINARALFRGSSVQRPFEACLDLVEYDETRLPFFFFDEMTGVPLGRAWLNWYYDVYSSIPIGFYVGFEPPSDLTMASALRHACLPKGYVNEAYPTIQHRYVGGGVPRRATYDNGLSQWSMSSPVRVAELMSARDRLARSAEEISLAAAIEQLGTNSRSVLEAAKRGYLLVGRRNASGQIASFDASSFHQLMIDYVFNRKLSSQLGISPHATYARMQSRGFKPAIAPHNTIEGLWRRGDVEQLDDILPLL